MPSNRRYGSVLIGLAFAISALSGLWFATQVTSSSMSTVWLVAGIVFVIVLIIATMGIYLYIREDVIDDNDVESLVQKQRELVDLLREKHQLSIQEAAASLGVSPEDVDEMVSQLIELDVFPGRLDQEQGILYHVPPNL